MRHTVQSHRLVKQNYRCRIHSESFITSQCPPRSPTASSLFSRGALLEIHPINVIAGDCLIQSSASSQSLLRSMAIAPRLPAVTLKDYPGTLQEEKLFDVKIYLIISEGLSSFIPLMLGIMNWLHYLTSHTWRIQIDIGNQGFFLFNCPRCLSTFNMYWPQRMKSLSCGKIALNTTFVCVVLLLFNDSPHQVFHIRNKGFEWSALTSMWDTCSFFMMSFVITLGN